MASRRLLESGTDDDGGALAGLARVAEPSRYFFTGARLKGGGGGGGGGAFKKKMSEG